MTDSNTRKRIIAVPQLGYEYFDREVIDTQDAPNAIIWVRTHTTPDNTSTHVWKEVYTAKSSLSSSERRLCMEVFKQALHDWLDVRLDKGAKTKNDDIDRTKRSVYESQRRAIERTRIKNSARLWFEDKTSWDIHSFNFIATEIIGVKSLDTFRRIILDRPNKVIANIANLYETENEDTKTNSKLPSQPKLRLSTQGHISFKKSA